MASKKNGTAHTTRIKRCECAHDHQDNLYGRGNRVCNLTGGKKPPAFRCTVCGKEHAP